MDKRVNVRGKRYGPEGGASIINAWKKGTAKAGDDVRRDIDS
jgi:hypothetical protein